MKITVRDLIQFLLLHCELDDVFYGFEFWYMDSKDSMTMIDEDTILEWIRETHDD